MYIPGTSLCGRVCRRHEEERQRKGEGRVVEFPRRNEGDERDLVDEDRANNPASYRLARG